MKTANEPRDQHFKIGFIGDVHERTQQVDMLTPGKNRTNRRRESAPLDWIWPD
jgi:hypothetical protein